MSESNIEPEAAPLVAPPIDAPSAEAIAAIRAQIDSIDSSLLDLVARRLALADGLAALCRSVQAVKSICCAG